MIKNFLIKNINSHILKTINSHVLKNIKNYIILLIIIIIIVYISSSGTSIGNIFNLEGILNNIIPQALCEEIAVEELERIIVTLCKGF
jgi:hypothetical protein